MDRKKEARTEGRKEERDREVEAFVTKRTLAVLQSP